MAVIDDLYRIYVGSTPPDVTATALGEDLGYVIAEVFSVAYSEIQRLIAGSSLSTAVGTFLELHAKDRGLRKQSGETEDQLRERLRKPPLAGTVPAILSAVTAIVGNAGQVILIELPLSSAYYDRDSFYDRAERAGGGRGVVIVIIPASANAKNAVIDAVRSKVSAGKIWRVEEYT